MPRFTRPFWWLLAYASLGLGILGIFLPGLPTVPLVLLSAYAAARGSARLHRWLLAHPRFGPMIRDWQDGGRVSRPAKRLALLTMTLSGLLMLWLLPHPLHALPGITVMLLVAVWLWHRPE